jgi:RNA polymerase sigma-70 factor, ECF subfamily
MLNLNISTDSDCHSYNLPRQEEYTLKTEQNIQQALNRFLSGVERRAYRMAEIATGNSHDALDLVQDAMLGLVKNYAHKEEAEWGPLFHRLLQNRIRDWYRRNTVRNKFRGWLSLSSNEDEHVDPIQMAVDHYGKTPEENAGNRDSMNELDVALKALPLRQQQAFLLRNWEGMSVKQSALAMGCSQSSAKTHYSRAVKSLRVSLKDHYGESL